MIRRAFWLTVGAVLGVTGYRKAAALAHALAPPPAPAQARIAVRARPGAAALLARGVGPAAAFIRDVRDGMRLYRLREPPAPPTLDPDPQDRHRIQPDWAHTRALIAGKRSDDAKDGR